MPKTAKPLTDYVVKTLKASREQQGWRELSDGGCRGLLLRISPRGEKAWAVRLTVNGRRVLQTIGAYPTVTLGEARSRATDYAAASRDGMSPEELDARHQAETMTVTMAHSQYIADVRGGLSANTVSLKRRMFATHIEPVAGNRLLRKIRRADVVEVVQAVKTKGHQIQSNRVFSEFMATLRWAELRGYVDGVPTFHKFKVREQPRSRTLTEAELREVWRLSEELGDLTRDFIRLLLLTGQRRDEVRLMSWDEVDLEQGLWVIPAQRYKTRIDQAVPLSEPALSLLNNRAEKFGKTGYVLTGRDMKPFNGAASAARRLQMNMPGKGDFTLHDFRRTVRTGLSRLGVDSVTAELVLGHRPQGIQRVYDLHDRLKERHEALERWGEFVLSISDESSNVIPLRARS